MSVSRVATVVAAAVAATLLVVVLVTDAEHAYLRHTHTCLPPSGDGLHITHRHGSDEEFSVSSFQYSVLQEDAPFTDEDEEEDCLDHAYPDWREDGWD